MHRLAVLILFLLCQAFLMPKGYAAFLKAPECPDYSTREDCLSSVDQDFQNFLDFIKDEYEEKDKDQLILAAHDIKYYESLACKKTCLN